MVGTIPEPEVSTSDFSITTGVTDSAQTAATLSMSDPMPAGGGGLHQVQQEGDNNSEVLAVEEACEYSEKQDGVAKGKTKSPAQTKRYGRCSAAAERGWGRAAATVAAQKRARRRLSWDFRLRLQIFWLFVFFSALGFFFGWRYQQYNRGPKRALFGWSLPIAKACGNAMKIVIWPVLILPLSYVFTTQLRHTFINELVPFDDAISFHRMVAVIGGSLAVVHTICHIIDYAHAARQPPDLWSAAFPEDPQPKSFGQLMNQESTYVGFGMLATLSTMFSFALPYPRKFAWLKAIALGRVLNNFNWFWATHKIGGGIFYSLLLVHPLPCIARNVENPFRRNPSAEEWGVSDTWVYITLPILIRLADRCIRWWRRNKSGSRILCTEFLGDDLVALDITKPSNFNFRPGMFVYLNIPSVALHEWHPLSLAGSPSAGVLSVMLRSSGDWASGVYDLLRDKVKSPTGSHQSGSQQSHGSTSSSCPDEDVNHERSALSNTRIYIDGPFGAPAVAYSRFDVVLLVGTGVGITPFLSMVADAVEQRSSLDIDSTRKGGCKGCLGQGRVPLEIHFHWLVAKPSIPSCLRRTLERAVDADASGMLDLNLHVTRASSRTDSFLRLQQALGAEGGQAQLLLDPELCRVNAVKVWCGRPDFGEIFSKLEGDNVGGKVGVFFCGNPGLGGTLRGLAHAASARRRTVFHFHQEIF